MHLIARAKLGTVSKALGLLDILAQSGTRHGLTEIARLSGNDKATTRRLLVELKANGFVEQPDGGRDYVLGSALLTLGRAREDQFPFFKIVQPIIRALAEATGETSHASEYSAGVMNSVCSQQSDKSNRVIVRSGEKLPLHATASGLAFLASCSADEIDIFLRKSLPSYTEATLTQSAQIMPLIAEARSCGYSMSNQLREEGVHSVAAAILNPHRRPIGAVAVAMPSVRATPEKLALTGEMAIAAAKDISVRLFGLTAVSRKTP